jgi:hypothetical protein
LLICAKALKILSVLLHSRGKRKKLSPTCRMMLLPSG